MFRESLQIKKKIGEGQFGHVFLAYSSILQKEIVLKRIQKRHGCREHQLLPFLKHPNIIKVIQVLEEGEELVEIALQYAAKGDLASYVKRQFSHEHIPERLIRSWLLQLCLALHFLHHEQNIIHRDVKLINVLVMDDGRIKLADFGLAKRIKMDEQLAKSTVGTPYYLAPESISFGSFTMKSDVWGLGCLAYELCTGSKPFKGKAFGEIFHNIVEGFVEEFPPQAQYSRWLQGLVNSMLQKNLQKRPTIMGILEDPEMRKQFQLLKATYKQYQNYTYPDFELKTTKNNEVQQKFGLSSFKLFSQSLKTSKKDKLGRIPFAQPKETNLTSKDSKKIQRQKYANKSLQYFLNKRDH